MTTAAVDKLSRWIVDAATVIASGSEPRSEEPPHFLEEPALVPALVQMIATLDEKTLNENQALYSACLFALDVCVSQLQFASENGNKRATRAMDVLMEQLVQVIQDGSQSINFWLPVMSAFYDAQVTLSPALQDMYLMLAEEESEALQVDGIDHLQSMRELIAELSDLSTFELTAHFFAQSHAMPADFFAELVVDLCSIEEGQDAALLTLLHPRAEVREIVMTALDSVISDITLSSISLSRLQAIQTWLPDEYQGVVARWLREQRKKGVVFAKLSAAKILKIQASEVDGGGAQGLFLQIKDKRLIKLAGLLIKDGIGMKDAWITPGITSEEVTRYCREVLDDGVTLRNVDLNYICRMVNHFLAVTMEKGNVPNLHFLELQEALGVHFLPEPLDVSALMEQLSIQIEPFTQETIDKSLQRSAHWLKKKPFAASWYLENERVDRLVNRSCSFVDGLKVCRFEEAMDAVFDDEMEHTRAQWVFHFLWAALWLKASARKHEKAWQDSFLIAHTIQSGVPLRDIPLMSNICHRSVVNSVETMRDRRTHLSQE